MWSQCKIGDSQESLASAMQISNQAIQKSPLVQIPGSLKEWLTPVLSLAPPPQLYTLTPAGLNMVMSFMAFVLWKCILGYSPATCVCTGRLTGAQKYHSHNYPLAGLHDPWLQSALCAQMVGPGTQMSRKTSFISILSDLIDNFTLTYVIFNKGARCLMLFNSINN